jgi:alpha-glucoside transport system substrate-binding protein
VLILTSVAALIFGACAAQPAATPSPSPSSAPTSGASEAPATSTAPSGANAELQAALAGEYRGTTVDMLGQWIEAEGQAFDDSLKSFRDATGIDVVYSGITNYETVLNVRVDGGLAPDVAQLAQSGGMRKFQADGKLVDLSTVLDMDTIGDSYSQGFLDAGSVDGKLYGVYYKQDLKSIVWYPVKAFEEKGYKVPTTWDELVALSDQIVADGSNPWCTSIEHTDASGWVATDWIEDVLLRTAPVETYDKWAAHELPFNDPAVLNAAELVSKMFFTPDYVYGGSARINQTWVGDSQTPMFDAEGPKCWMHKQAAWIPDFWPKDEDDQPLFKPGVDSSFFYFPPIDPQYGNPVLGGSDMFIMFNDRPEVRALIQWLTSVEGVKDRIATGAFLAANTAVPPEWYTSYPMSGLAEIARTATLSRPDASDGMPTEVQSAFWKGMVKWVSQNGEGTEAILQEVEAGWPE